MVRKTVLIGGIAALIGLAIAAMSASADFRSLDGTPILARSTIKGYQITLGNGNIQCGKETTEAVIQKAATQEPDLVGAHLLQKTFGSGTCTAQGFTGSTTTPFVKSYDFQFRDNIPNVSIEDSIKSAVQIKLSDGEGHLCTVTIPVVAENENVGSFSAENVGHEIYLKGQVKGMVGEGEESTLCKENGINGKFKGVQMKEEADFGEAHAISAPEGGPYWRHREGKTGGGSYIAESAPETVEGSGGEQKLVGEISTTPVEISAKEESVKGVIYNNNDEGQLKLVLTYHEAKLIKPAIKECTAKIGEANAITVAGHLAWKWNGTKAQLEEETQAAQTPYIVLDPAGTEIKEGAEELPKGQFTTVTFSASCGVLADGKFKMEGSATAEPKPLHVEEWSKKPSFAGLPGKQQQHISNGEKYLGIEPGLILDGKTASLTGSTELSATKQEIAIFES